jgi:hypothetical protein
MATLSAAIDTVEKTASKIELIKSSMKALFVSRIVNCF